MNNERENKPLEGHLETNEDDVLKTIIVSLETAREISQHFDEDDAFNRINPLNSSVSEAEITKKLNRRFKLLLRQYANIDDPNASVKIYMSGSEIDHYNSFSGPEFWKGIDPADDPYIKQDIRHFGGLIRTTPEEDEHILQNYRESYLEMKSQMLKAWRELNLSSIKAGVKPRNDFIKYYEGPLPQPER